MVLAQHSGNHLVMISFLVLGQTSFSGIKLEFEIASYS